jgi:phosphopantetheinyl transferase
MKLILVFLLFLCCTVFYKASGQPDNLTAQQFCDREIKALRAKKPRQIKRIENKDSSIIYGADKTKTQLLIVSSHNRIAPFHVQFQYNEQGVFCITVLRSSLRSVGQGLKTKNSSYYFDKGKLIGGKEEDSGDDVVFLKAEADRHWKLGIQFLKEH